jgi:hypothetical protein
MPEILSYFSYQRLILLLFCIIWISFLSPVMPLKIIPNKNYLKSLTIFMTFQSRNTRVAFHCLLCEQISNSSMLIIYIWRTQNFRYFRMPCTGSFPQAYTASRIFELGLRPETANTSITGWMKWETIHVPCISSFILIWFYVRPLFITTLQFTFSESPPHHNLTGNEVIQSIRCVCHVE